MTAKASAANFAVSHRNCGWLGRLPLPLGEGWGEGLRSLGKSRTPSPQPSWRLCRPRRGEGAHRARLTFRAQSNRTQSKIIDLIIDHHTPGYASDRDRYRGLAGAHVDHRHVIAKTIGHIERSF